MVYSDEVNAVEGDGVTTLDVLVSQVRDHNVLDDDVTATYSHLGSPLIAALFPTPGMVLLLPSSVA